MSEKSAVSREENRVFWVLASLYFLLIAAPVSCTQVKIKGIESSAMSVRESPLLTLQGITVRG
jgi:hypothetical protein